MDLSALSSLEPAHLRMLLPKFLAGFITDPEAARANHDRVAAFVADWDDATCRRVVHALATIGDEQRVYHADPDCRQLARIWSTDVVLQPELAGIGHLRDAIARGPTLVLCNHLSYFDSTAIDAILTWSGHTDLADRLMSAAGPKVYQALFRKVAAACLNTLPVPQSTSFSHTEQLTPRELARRALASLEAASQATADGYVLLLYPEGSRSRSGRMGPFLKAVHRYLKIAEAVSVVPAAITGTERLMPVDDERMYPHGVTLRFGPALPVTSSGGLDQSLPARDALATAHQAIANLLTEPYRPDPDAAAVT